MIWWGGMRGLINDIRKNKLGVSPVSYFNMHHVSISHLPTVYMWSPLVMPKPNGKRWIILNLSSLIHIDPIYSYCATNFITFPQIGAALLMLLVTAFWILDLNSDHLKNFFGGCKMELNPFILGSEAWYGLLSLINGSSHSFTSFTFRFFCVVKRTSRIKIKQNYDLFLTS